MLFDKYMKSVAPDKQALMAGMQGFINRGVGPGLSNLLNLFIKNPKQRLETSLERHFWKVGIHFAHPMIEPVHDKPISQSSDRRRGLSSNVARI